nr:hypothetical protein [Acuticoccus kandeliae]
MKGVEATPGGLLKSTLLAMAGATVIIVGFYLPAEYGIDPTGVGSITGLTTMGEIKQQLYAEAAAETAATASPGPQILDRLDAIEAQVSAIANNAGVWTRADLDVPQVGTPAPEEEAVAVTAAPLPVAAPAPPVATEQSLPSAWRDEVSYTLAPTEGIEVKLVMDEGARAEFEWTANGGVLNYDTHGDGGGQNITYERGRGEPSQSGELVAAFRGNHGWFWRNRTSEPVTMTLRTRGQYASMKLP